MDHIFNWGRVSRSRLQAGVFPLCLTVLPLATGMSGQIPAVGKPMAESAPGVLVTGSDGPALAMALVLMLIALTPGLVCWVRTGLRVRSNSRLMVENATDVTRRKQAEEALRTTEARLALSQRIGKLGSWDLDLATQELVWSAETYLIFGRQPDSFKPTREVVAQLVHREEARSQRGAGGCGQAVEPPFGRAHSTRVCLQPGAAVD